MDHTVDEMKFACLFRAVIRQAAKDAFGVSSTATNKDFYKEQARIFLSGSKDLRSICELAEINQNDIINIMKSLNDSDFMNYKRIENVLNKKL